MQRYKEASALVRPFANNVARGAGGWRGRGGLSHRSRRTMGTLILAQNRRMSEMTQTSAKNDGYLIPKVVRCSECVS